MKRSSIIKTSSISVVSGHKLTRSSRHVRVKSDWHDEAVLLLLVEVLEVILPLPLNYVCIDEAVRVRRVLDEHERG
jgi:hypothetical protein